MKIAVEGCAHGRLEEIYNTLGLLERRDKVNINLLICCGDFQSTRNLQDLRCMAVPPKYYDICSFYKYYTGEKVAPYLTIFIGGNHEASNYLQELPYGGWVAPNIYYLGYAGVVNIGGIRIGGLSGIYKPFDYYKGRFEVAPYDDYSKRTVYHIRSLEVFRLKQLSQTIDVFFSHDWPANISQYGNVKKLLKMKPFFEADITAGKLGSGPSEELLLHLRPAYWFAAHLHCKFAAVVPHATDSKQKVTKFLSLDKCLPKRKFLQVLDIPHDPDMSIEIRYDLEWLTILYLTNHLLSIKPTNQYMPGPTSSGRWNFTPTHEEKDFILKKFDYDLIVPNNFKINAQPYNPDEPKTKVKQPDAQLNPQTKLFCEKLGIDDPVELLMMINNSDKLKGCAENLSASVDSADSSFTSCLSEPADNKPHKLNLSLPNPKFEPLVEPKMKLNLTLPPPKYTEETTSFSIISLDQSSQETDVSDTSLSFDITLPTSTPQAKKFKRRNESIYSNNDNT